MIQDWLYFHENQLSLNHPIRVHTALMINLGGISFAVGLNCCRGCLDNETSAVCRAVFLTNTHPPTHRGINLQNSPQQQG